MNARSILSLRECRNEDGSWNGVKTLATLTYRSEDEVRSIWARIRHLNEECNMEIKDATLVAMQEHDLKKS